MSGTGVGATPVGPSHWKTGVSVTPLGREREQVRVTVAPVMTGDEGEELSEILAGSVREDQGTAYYMNHKVILCIKGWMRSLPYIKNSNLHFIFNDNPLCTTG